MTLGIFSFASRIVLVSTAFFALSCSAQEQEQIKLIDKSKYQEMVGQGGLQLLDVRTAKEYSAGHIGEAVNIDFYADDFVEQCEQEFDKSQPLVLYCQAGGRSAKAAEQLAKAGFQTVCDIDGGYGQWDK